MQWQGYDLIGIKEAWWDSLHDGVLPWMDRGSLGRTGWEGEEEKPSSLLAMGRYGALPRDG